MRVDTLASQEERSCEEQGASARCGQCEGSLPRSSRRVKRELYVVHCCVNLVLHLAKGGIDPVICDELRRAGRLDSLYICEFAFNLIED